MVRVLLALFAALWLTGCAVRHASQDHVYEAGYYDEYYEEEPYEEAVTMGGSGGFLDRLPSGRSYQAPASMAAPAPAAPPGQGDLRSEDSSADAETPASTASAGRMIFYNGYLHLRITQPEETAQGVAELARSLGGHVEALSAQRVTVRVPVAAFEDAFSQLMSLGEVLDRDVSAEDVTDAFVDTSLRLQTLKSTQERLVELLAQAQTEREKLALLREIQRVSEQIDVVEGQKRVLADLAAFSRITVTLSPRGDVSQRAYRSDAEGLGWIQSLSPFSRSVGAEGRRLSLMVPEGMVQLSTRGRFIAESADGAIVWTGRVENQPEGSASFWVDAIEQRLGSEFDVDAAEMVGGFVMLRMVELETPEGYRYLIGLRTEGKWLEIVQVYYPSQDHEQRYQEAVMTAIAGGQS